MTPRDASHVRRILDWVVEALPRKYEQGKIEHGGELWRKKGISEMMDDEIIDFIVYHRTLKEQLQEYRCECGRPIELGESEDGKPDTTNI